MGGATCRKGHNEGTRYAVEAPQEPKAGQLANHAVQVQPTGATPKDAPLTLSPRRHQYLLRLQHQHLRAEISIIFSTRPLSAVNLSTSSHSYQSTHLAPFSPPPQQKAPSFACGVYPALKSCTNQAQNEGSGGLLHEFQSSINLTGCRLCPRCCTYIQTRSSEGREQQCPPFCIFKTVDASGAASLPESGRKGEKMMSTL
jgi:hypothetical protein